MIAVPGIESMQERDLYSRLATLLEEQSALCDLATWMSHYEARVLARLALRENTFNNLDGVVRIH